MKHIAPLLLLLLALCAGCDRKVFFSDDQRVDERGWSLEDKLYYDVEVTDLHQLYTFYIDLRIANDYPYDRAFFFINTTFPDGSIAADTLGCPLAAPDGQWYGKRSGGYVDNRYIFKPAVRFPMQGKYRFEVQHAMRDTAIHGVKNVGLRIEKAASLSAAMK